MRLTLRARAPSDGGPRYAPSLGPVLGAGVRRRDVPIPLLVAAVVAAVVRDALALADGDEARVSGGDVGGIALDEDRRGALGEGGEARGARSGEGIEDDAPEWRDEADQPAEQAHGLDGGM